MKCIADRDYIVNRRFASSREAMMDKKPSGPISSLACAYCNFVVYKRLTSKPRTSKSGLGCYNRMRGIMVAHIHQEHREALQDANKATEAAWDALTEHGRKIRNV